MGYCEDCESGLKSDCSATQELVISWALGNGRKRSLWLWGYSSLCSWGWKKMATIVRLLKGKTGKFSAFACDNMAFVLKFIFNVKTVLIFSCLYIRLCNSFWLWREGRISVQNLVLRFYAFIFLVTYSQSHFNLSLLRWGLWRLGGFVNVTENLQEFTLYYRELIA